MCSSDLGVETLTKSPLVLGVYHVVFPLCVVAGAVGDLAAVWELVEETLPPASP